MATIKLKAGDDYLKRLSQLEGRTDEISKAAIYEGAGIVADQIKANLQAIPEDTFRYLRDGDKFSGLPRSQKVSLDKSFGIAPISRDTAGDWNTKLGFDGYQQTETNCYPNGLPNALLARAVESGSPVRQKHPFVRPAVTRTRKPCLEKMRQTADEKCKEIMKR